MTPLSDNHRKWVDDFLGQSSRSTSALQSGLQSGRPSVVVAQAPTPTPPTTTTGGANAQPAPPTNPIDQLTKAIELDDPAVASLINSGLNLEDADSAGMTPLMQAAKFDRVQIAKTLIDTKGVQVDGVNTSRDTPLLVAVRFDKVAVARVLLDKGARVDEHGVDHDFPLIVAVDKKLKAMRDLILEDQYKANVNNSGKGGQTALMKANEVDDDDSINVLLAHKDIKVDRDDNLRETALFGAARKNPDRVQRLLDRDADPNKQERGLRMTVLMEMAMSNTEQGNAVANVLVKHKAKNPAKRLKLDMKDREGRTALMLAIKAGNTSFIDLLPKDDATSVNLKQVKEERIKKLEEKEGPVEKTSEDEENAEENTALIMAVKSQNVDAVQAMLKFKKLDLDVQNNNKMTALMVSVGADRPVSIVEMLLLASTDINPKGPNKDFQGPKSKTALHLAAENANVDAVEKLLARKASRDKMDNKGKTALENVEALLKSPGHPQAEKLQKIADKLKSRN